MSMLGLVARGAAVFAGAGMVALVASALATPWSAHQQSVRIDSESFTPDSSGPGFAIERTDAVVLRRDGSTAVGWLVLPRGTSPRFAAIVVQGAGGSDRAGTLPIAEELARSGIAALVVDKRTDGYSPITRDFDQLARDAEDAARMLTEHPLMRGVPVVAIGISEGGWIAPLAVAAAPDVFSALVLVSPTVVSPLSQAMWVVDGFVEAAPELVRRVAASAIAAGRGILDYLDEDADAALAEIAVPIYAVWGAEDQVAPVATALATLRDIARAPVSAIILPNAGHDPPIDMWVPDAARWLGELPGAADNYTRGVAPATIRAATVPPAAVWYSDARTHALFSLAVTSLFIAILVRNRKGQLP